MNENEKREEAMKELIELCKKYDTTIDELNKNISDMAGTIAGALNELVKKATELLLPLIEICNENELIKKKIRIYEKTKSKRIKKKQLKLIYKEMIKDL